MRQRLEQIERDGLLLTRIHFDLPREHEGIAGHLAADVRTFHRRMFGKGKAIVSSVRRVWVSDDDTRIQFVPHAPTFCPVVDLIAMNPLPSAAEMDRQHRGYLALAVHPSRISMLRAWTAGEDSQSVESL